MPLRNAGGGLVQSHSAFIYGMWAIPSTWAPSVMILAEEIREGMNLEDKSRPGLLAMDSRQSSGIDLLKSMSAQRR